MRGVRLRGLIVAALIAAVGGCLPVEPAYRPDPAAPQAGRSRRSGCGGRTRRSPSARRTPTPALPGPLVGGRVMDLQTEQMVPLGQTAEVPSEEQPGESSYEASLTLPAGRSVLEFKLIDEGPDVRPVAFRGWAVEAK